MLSAVIALSIVSQQVTTPSDLPPAPAAEAEQEWEQEQEQEQELDETELSPAEMRKIYVTDSQEASRTQTDHPLQQVCVRRPKPGSRVKAQTVCQDTAAWKAYVMAQEANFYEWDSAQRGLDVK